MTEADRRYYETIEPLYARAFAAHGDDLRSIFTPKGRQAVRYARMIGGLTFESVLDVGSGTGLLKEYLDAHGLSHVAYTGVDIVSDLVDLCRRKFPGARFEHVTEADAIEGTFDLVVVAGTFNVVPEGFAIDSYRAFVFDTLARLFTKARRCLVFDFQNDLVDFRQERALHLSHADVIAFVTARLSRRFAILQDYLPFEAAARVFADDRVDRAASTFAAPTGADRPLD